MPHLQQAAWRMCAVNPLASQAQHDGGWRQTHELLWLTGPVPAHLRLIAQHRSLTLAVSRLTVMAFGQGHLLFKATRPLTPVSMHSTMHELCCSPDSP